MTVAYAYRIVIFTRKIIIPLKKSPPKTVTLSDTDKDIGEPELWNAVSHKAPWFLTRMQWADSLQIDALM